jgi:hypothetical protein
MNRYILPILGFSLPRLIKDSDLFTVFFQVLPKEKRVNMLAVSHFRVFACIACFARY